ncbi:MAG TPA: photosynthetic complex putative assembly protein PuhB [Polyangiaceae bacterium LLY-WYZ-14_1]|nr:photosynthetic complex putative assembly protein PuhB [Polyangiaceae bacterium LLY-WYZ-14_1]
MKPDDLEYIAQAGLPSALPPGEHVVWQGRPEWKALARQSFKLPWLAIYFGVIVAVRATFAVVNGEGAAGLNQVLFLVGLFGAGLGILALAAWLNARATIYTITTKRVVMEIGAALSMDWNLPFKRIVGADLQVRDGGDGDIVLRLAPSDRVRWLYFFPHVVGLLQPKPALRGIREPEKVAGLLQNAVASWAREEAAQVEVPESSSELGERAQSSAPAPRDFPATGIVVHAPFATEASR